MVWVYNFAVPWRMKIKSRGNKQSELFSRPIIQLDILRACENLRFSIALYLSRISFENVVVRSLIITTMILMALKEHIIRPSDIGKAIP